MNITHVWKSFICNEYFSGFNWNENVSEQTIISFSVLLINQKISTQESFFLNDRVRFISNLIAIILITTILFYCFFFSTKKKLKRWSAIWYCEICKILILLKLWNNLQEILQNIKKNAIFS